MCITEKKRSAKVPFWKAVNVYDVNLSLYRFKCFICSIVYKSDLICASLSVVCVQFT